MLLAPFEVGGGFLQAAFVIVDGAVIEFMQYANPDEEGCFSAPSRKSRDCTVWTPWNDPASCKC